MSLLKKDLCMYYSYNSFLIERLIDLFPLSEVGVQIIVACGCSEYVFRYDWDFLTACLLVFLQLVDFLEANEIQRPVTIRTNTLKTRRRDLAQVAAETHRKGFNCCSHVFTKMLNLYVKLVDLFIYLFIYIFF